MYALLENYVLKFFESLGVSAHYLLKLKLPIVETFCKFILRKHDIAVFLKVWTVKDLVNHYMYDSEIYAIHTHTVKFPL